MLIEFLNSQIEESFLLRNKQTKSHFDTESVIRIKLIKLLINIATTTEDNSQRTELGFSILQLAFSSLRKRTKTYFCTLLIVHAGKDKIF